MSVQKPKQQVFKSTGEFSSEHIVKLEATHLFPRPGRVSSPVFSSSDSRHSFPLFKVVGDNVFVRFLTDVT